MKHNVINFLRAAFPYLITAGLWRLSTPFWNPGGVLALIPIFYCTFVRPRPWFGAMGAMFCFLIDYNFNTVFYWTSIFCVMYAINGFQNIIDLTQIDRNAVVVFLFFFAVSVIILVLTHFDVSNVLRGIWLIAWAGVLYTPTTELIKKVAHD